MAIGARAQEATANVRIGDRDKDKDKEFSAEIDRNNVKSVSKVNKATSLTGMAVKNSNNEKLGDVKDIVLDLTSGKISYVVLSVGGFLGIGDRLVAVPANTFRVDPTTDALILDADKAKLQAAPAFAQSDWPNLDDSDIGVYWKVDRDSVGTSGAKTEIRQDRSVDLDRSENATRDNAEKEGKGFLKSQSTRENQGPVFSGKIVSIDPEKRVMRIEGDSGTREFSFTERPTLVVGGSTRNATLVDFKVGYNVNVGYHEEDGRHVAHRVIRTDPPSTR
jgi:sporulation protein YlmC with PRC-barrel domain